VQQSLTAGAVIGSYRIEARDSEVAAGWGAVYLAEHVHLRRRVALWVLPPGLADDPALRERFIRESQLSASIDQPNIIPVHDADDEDGVLYLAMRCRRRSRPALRRRRREERHALGAGLRRHAPAGCALDAGDQGRG
jgi:hypothetical protein